MNTKKQTQRLRFLENIKKSPENSFLHNVTDQEPTLSDRLLYS